MGSFTPFLDFSVITYWMFVLSLPYGCYNNHFLLTNRKIPIHWDTTSCPITHEFTHTCTISSLFYDNVQKKKINQWKCINGWSRMFQIYLTLSVMYLRVRCKFVLENQHKFNRLPWIDLWVDWLHSLAHVCKFFGHHLHHATRVIVVWRTTTNTPGCACQ